MVWGFVVMIHYGELCGHDVLNLLPFASSSQLVANLTGWPSVRVVQDQTWLKPPSSQALAFHRDRGYFMFKSAAPFLPDKDCVNGVRIVTLWIALDDMDDELGPLEYAVSSHKWKKSSPGTNPTFFDTSDFRHMANAAAGREPGMVGDPEFVSMSGLPRGALSVHDGDTYHGSGPNRSRTRCRRGVGIHYVRGDVEWDVDEALKSKIWRPYVEGKGGGGVGIEGRGQEGGGAERTNLKLDDRAFPIVWRKEV